MRLASSLRKWVESALILVLLATAKTGLAEQTLQLIPGKPHSEQMATAALNTRVGETLRIERLQIDDAHPKVVNLALRRSEVTSADTQYIVVDQKGSRTFPLATSAHFIGAIEGLPESYAFVSVSSDGEIHTIIHQGDETILNELIPERLKADGRAISRTVDQQKDFTDREFSCGVTPTFLQKDPAQRNVRLESLLKQGKINANSIVSEKAGSLRRADIIIDSDYEFFQKFGTEAATFTYITNLLAYISSRYQTEVATRFNLKQILIRTTPTDPWTQASADLMLNELQAYWNAGANASVPRHHVHLLSGKPVGAGIAYVGSLSNPSIAYGVSAGLSGSFNPSSPQVIWDSVVVAHEIGHAFGSSHTHDYDNPFIAPSPNTGGAIDCCYSGNATGQCGLSLGGAGLTGYLPGLSSITGGGAGQRNGTIMSYCHLVLGGMANLSWTFGTNHPYGVNPGRVPAVMSSQAQAKLPLDASGTSVLMVTKAGNGTVTSSPAGINCGLDCNEAFPDGTAVTLTPTPAAGNVFSGWSGDCTGSGACTVTVNTLKSVTATFTTVPVGLLSIAKIGTGTGTVTRAGGAINCGATCIESLAPGSAVTLSANPAPGSTFAGWSGGACSGSGTCAFTINANTTVNAQFNLNTGGPTFTPLVQSNLSGAAGSTQYFTITVPAGATNLVIQISGGTGDADLYVDFGNVPTLSTYICRPYLVGNNESCLPMPNPAAGTYHIMIAGYESFSGVTLAASYQKANTGNPADIGTIINLLLLN